MGKIIAVVAIVIVIAIGVAFSHLTDAGWR